MRPISELVEWIFLATYLGIEILSAACDQASSPRRPHYALFGMLLAIAAVLISIGELIYRGIREKVELGRWGILWWYCHPSPPHTPFGTLPDIFGLVAGISQCICSMVQYVYCLRHADTPLKASLLPAIFLMCLVGRRLFNKQTNVIEQQEQEQLWLGEPQELEQLWLGEPQEQEQELVPQRMNANTTDNMDSWENSSSTEETSLHPTQEYYDNQEVEVEGNIEEQEQWQLGEEQEWQWQELRRRRHPQQQLMLQWLQPHPQQPLPHQPLQLWLQRLQLLLRLWLQWLRLQLQPWMQLLLRQLPLELWQRLLQLEQRPWQRLEELPIIN